MNKNAILGLGALVVITVAVLVFGLSGGSSETPAAAAGDEANGAAAGNAAEGGESGAAKVGRDEHEGGASDEEKTAELKLPGALPSLGLSAQDPIAAPAKAHSEVEIEGTLEQVDAEKAIRAIFPKVRACYAELRERAPQAQGRMLMKLKVRRGDDGQAGTGELFLKETQFTDPKYLTCVRTATDETKFKTDAAQVDGSFTFTLWLTPDDADNHRKAAAEAGGAPAAGAE
jgi:hypothetical protein